MQVEVEGDGPHDDEPRVQVLDLPRHSPARSRRRAALQTNQSAQFAMSSSNTVDMGYSVTGYSVISAIVSVLRWDRFLYTNNYLI